MKQIFKLQKNEDSIVLFNLKGMNNLNMGDIFFRRNEDNTTDILEKYEYLDKEYLDSVLDKLSDEYEYDFSLLVSKTI